MVGGWPTALTNWHDTIGLGSASRFYRVRADLLAVPPPVADVRVQPEEGTLAVRWAAVPLATSYTLYWSTNQPFVAGEAQAQTVTRTEFILLDPFAGLDYFFAVRALGQQGASDLSAVVSGMAFPPALPFRRTTLGDSTAFLYSGPSPLQRDVAPGTIDPQRVAIVRSTIRSRAGAALGGVTVRVAQRPEFGFTESGRWTTPDPLLHQSRDPNPYLYASGNPVSYRDPWGLLCVAASAYAGISGGGSINECGKASLDASASLGPSADARAIGKVGVSAKITVTHCWQLN